MRSSSPVICYSSFPSSLLVFQHVSCFLDSDVGEILLRTFCVDITGRAISARSFYSSRTSSLSAEIWRRMRLGKSLACLFSHREGGTPLVESIHKARGFVALSCCSRVLILKVQGKWIQRIHINTHCGDLCFSTKFSLWKTVLHRRILFAGAWTRRRMPLG